MVTIGFQSSEYVLAFLVYSRKTKLRYSFAHVDRPLSLIKDIRRQIIFN